MDAAVIRQLDAFTQEQHGGGISAVQIQGITAAGLQQELRAGSKGCALRMNAASFDEETHIMARFHDPQRTAGLKMGVGAVGEVRYGTVLEEDGTEGQDCFGTAAQIILRFEGIAFIPASPDGKKARFARFGTARTYLE